MGVMAIEMVIRRLKTWACILEEGSGDKVLGGPAGVDEVIQDRGENVYGHK